MEAKLNGPIVGSIIGVMSFWSFWELSENTVPVLVGIMD